MTQFNTCFTLLDNIFDRGILYSHAQNNVENHLTTLLAICIGESDSFKCFNLFVNFNHTCDGQKHDLLH